MKIIFAAFAVLSLSSSAFATEYNCSNLSSKNHIGFNAIISGQTIALTGGVAPTTSAKLNPSVASKSGYKAFTGEDGCISTPLKGFTNCGAIGIVTLQVSERLVAGAVQGDILWNGQTFSCDIVRLNQ